MTVNNGYYPHGRAMFSPQALAAFKQFVKIDNATVAQRPRGAQDAQHPRLARAIARDRKLARDQMEGEEGAGPDPEHVRRILDCVREALGDAAKSKVAKAIQQRWPESMLESDDDNENDMGQENDDDMTEDDFPSQTEMADADEPSGNPNRNRDYAGRGSEAFRVANDDPPDFPGMPKTGGKMVPQRNSEMSMDSAMDDYERCFPMAKRIGLDPTPGSGSHSAAVTPTTMRASRRGLAMDQKQYASGAAEDYARLFGSSNVRVL